MTEPTSEESALLTRHHQKLGGLGALMHVCKGTVGTGILGLPWAMKHAGMVVGPIFMVFIGLINLHCMLILVSSARHLARVLNTDPLDYGELAYMSVLHGPIIRMRPHAWKAKCFVNICLEITQLGLCCTYTVFVGQNLRQVIAIYWHDAPDVRVFMAILCVPFILISLIKDLSILAWFSSVANISGIISICLILKDILKDLPPVSSRPYITNGHGFAVFIGATVGAFEGIPVILPVANAMKNPKRYPMIIIIGISIIMCLYVGMAFVGLLKFGSEICGSITLNLPLGNVFSDTARILYCVAMFFTFPLQYFVATSILDTLVEENFGIKAEWCGILMRVGIVIAICSFSISIPFIGNLNSLIGATSSTMLVIFLPPCLHILAHRAQANIVTEENGDSQPTKNNIREESEEAEKQPSRLTLAKDLSIMFLATLAFFAGLIQTVWSIVDESVHYNSTRRCNGGVGNYHIIHSKTLATAITSTAKNITNL